MKLLAGDVQLRLVILLVLAFTDTQLCTRGWSDSISIILGTQSCILSTAYKTEEWVEGLSRELARGHHLFFQPELPGISVSILHTRAWSNLQAAWVQAVSHGDRGKRLLVEWHCMTLRAHQSRPVINLACGAVLVMHGDWLLKDVKVYNFYDRWVLTDLWAHFRANLPCSPCSFIALATKSWQNATCSEGVEEQATGLRWAKIYHHVMNWSPPKGLPLAKFFPNHFSASCRVAKTRTTTTRISVSHAWINTDIICCLAAWRARVKSLESASSWLQGPLTLQSSSLWSQLRHYRDTGSLSC